MVYFNTSYEKVILVDIRAGYIRSAIGYGLNIIL